MENSVSGAGSGGLYAMIGMAVNRYWASPDVAYQPKDLNDAITNIRTLSVLRGEQWFWLDAPVEYSGGWCVGLQQSHHTILWLKGEEVHRIPCHIHATEKATLNCSPCALLAGHMKLPVPTYLWFDVVQQTKRSDDPALLHFARQLLVLQFSTQKELEDELKSTQTY